MKGGVLFVDKF